MEKKQLLWNDALTLGAQKQEEPEEKETPKLSLDALDLDNFEPTEDDVSEVLGETELPEILDAPPRTLESDSLREMERKIENASQDISEIATEVPTKTPQKTGKHSVSLLDTIEGDIGEASTRAVLKSPLNTKRNVARFVDGKFEIIGLAPLTVIEATDVEVALLHSDHLLKNGVLFGKDREKALKFEQENLEIVKKLFGVSSVAELNDMTPEEFGKYFRKELSEGTKLMLQNVATEVGIEEIPNGVFNELADMESPTERDIFKAIIKHMK